MNKLRISQIFAVVVVLSMFAMFVPAIAAQTLNTTRLYSEKLGAGAGAWVPGENVANRITDPITHVRVEQQPYNTTNDGYPGVYSIFDPTDCCSPRKDSLTFNPLYISETLADDQSELGAVRGVALPGNLRVDGHNANEKVFFRQWYEPDYLDKDVDVTGWVTYRIAITDEDEPDTVKLIGSDDVPSSDGKYITAGPDGVLDSVVGDNDGDGAIEVPETRDFIQQVPDPQQDEHYPAILQEFTYMFTKAGPLSSETVPVSGEPGRSSIIFPVGIQEDLFNDSFGYGLTSIDPTLDGIDNPTGVEIQTEETLQNYTNIRADFNGNGAIDGLDDDNAQLSGDELLILSLPGIRAGRGVMTQFLDHAVVVEETYSSPNQVKLGVYYTGDLEPKFIGHILISQNAMVLLGTKSQIYTYIPAGGNNLASMPKGPFFVYVESIDATTNTVKLKLGRAVGATHSAMESASGTPDQTPGDPWWLKRFYVDGHEYNVVAIYSDPEDNDKFKFITVRTPIPKEGQDLDPVVLIEQHSVRLQPYEENRALSVMPPYNYEHTELTDVQAWNATEELTRFNNSDFVRPGFFVGNAYTAKPIYYHAPAAYITLDGHRVDITLEDLMFYVDEAQEPQLTGELKELYNENSTQRDSLNETDEWWYVEQFRSRPDLFTEFYLPIEHGLYLITLNYVNDANLQAVAEYRPDANGGTGAAGIIVSPSWVRSEETNEFPPRVMFWYNPETGGKKFKDDNSIRLYGTSFDEYKYVLEARCAIDHCDDIQSIAQMDPHFPINISDLIRAGEEDPTDPVTGALVEDAPYTNHEAIFSPQAEEAYPASILTLDPAWMDEYLTADELRDLGLYDKISIEGNDAREKVFARMWYEPFHLDKNSNNNTSFDITDEWYPAVMQEYTYMMVGVDNQPAHGLMGETQLAFPIGTRGSELDDSHAVPGPDGVWGYGLTTFDPLPYDGVDEADTVTLHSEQSLRNLTNLSIDFNGNGSLDPLDNDTVQFSGDELVIPTLFLNLHEGDKAQFLDYMIEVVAVDDGGKFGTGQVDLNIYRLGHTSGAPLLLRNQPLSPGQAVTVYLNGINPVIDKDGSNLNSPMTEKGPWFVYVNAVNPESNNAAITVGRALGATHTAMESAANTPDLTPGDPWYLKRFYVDGHEYNVVAIKTEPTDNLNLTQRRNASEKMEFKFITIRTPVQKVETVNDQHSFTSQSYFEDMPADTRLYVMPPFNFEHTGRKDIQPGWLSPEILMDPLGFMGPVEKHKGAFNATIVEEGIEEQFLGDLKELYAENTTVPNGGSHIFETWDKLVFWTAPFRYTDIRINGPDEKYLMKLDWEAPQGIFQTVNFGNEKNLSDPDFVILTDDLVDEPLEDNVKFWYDPRDTNDLYVNTKTVGRVVVRGFVNDVANKFDEGLYPVTVTISNTSFSNSTATDVAGNYNLGEINPGEYTITASMTGYINEVQLVTLQPSGVEVIDFTLEHGLIPSKPNTDYVMKAIKLWYKTEISLTKVLNVIAAWSS